MFMSLCVSIKWILVHFEIIFDKVYSNPPENPTNQSKKPKMGNGTIIIICLLFLLSYLDSMLFCITNDDQLT
jgi:hypothetical protein